MSQKRSPCQDSDLKMHFPITQELSSSAGSEQSRRWMAYRSISSAGDLGLVGESVRQVENRAAILQLYRPRRRGLL